jgi:predicted dinucleotide-binding enzyme
MNATTKSAAADAALRCLSIAFPHASYVDAASHAKHQIDWLVAYVTGVIDYYRRIHQFIRSVTDPKFVAPESTILRIGLIGCGRVGKKVAEAFVAHKNDCSITVFTRTPERVRFLKDLYGVPLPATLTPELFASVDVWIFAVASTQLPLVVEQCRAVGVFAPHTPIISCVADVTEHKLKTMFGLSTSHIVHCAKCPPVSTFAKADAVPASELSARVIEAAVLIDARCMDYLATRPQLHETERMAISSAFHRLLEPSVSSSSPAHVAHVRS